MSSEAIDGAWEQATEIAEDVGADMAAQEIETSIEPEPDLGPEPEA